MLLVLKGIQCLDGQERMEESEGSLKPVATAQHREGVERAGNYFEAL